MAKASSCGASSGENPTFMASEKADPDRTQAGGWYAEGGGSGPTLHVREELLLHGMADPPIALVIRCYADFWTTEIDDWKGTNR